MNYKYLAALVSLVSAVNASANSFNTNYVPVTEIKVWRSVIDVYTESIHQCPDQSYGKRLLLDKEENEMYSLLLAAMTTGRGANINYVCDQAGIPRLMACVFVNSPATGANDRWHINTNLLGKKI